MNKFLGYTTLSMLSIGMIMSFNVQNENLDNNYSINSDFNLEIPEEVSAVLNEYCFGCHNTESRNEKGKKDLTIDNLGDLPKGKLAAKLNKIAKEVDEGHMPPEKFLAKNPDKEPSKKDKKTIVKWAKAAAKEL